MKIKVSASTPIQLNWLVAKCAKKLPISHQASSRHWWSPSTNWNHGGPIIERECITIEYMDRNYWRARLWNKEIRNYSLYQYSSTPLIAAMRCFVASKLGDEVDVPEELCP